jgi:hypothetical protein
MDKAPLLAIAPSLGLAAFALLRPPRHLRQIMCCGIGSCWLLLRSASESGRLRHGHGDSEGGKRCRRGA